jgi:serine/threonine-protein kinase
LYLRGQYGFRTRNAASLAQATDYYAQALARDPSYALAYVGLSRSYGTRAYMGYLPQDDAYPTAIAASKKAIDLDERLATAHAALAPALLQYERNWIQSEREFQRALALDPDSADVHYLYGAFFSPTSVVTTRLLPSSGERNPRSARSRHSDASWARLTNARRFDEAIVALRRALALDPDFVQAHRFLALTYGLKARATRSRGKPPAD